MSVQTVNETNGQYQISKDVSTNDLEKLCSNPTTSSIQFVNPLNDKDIDNLERIVFSKRPDISLRVYGHYGLVCDLTFLERMPSLRKLTTDCLMQAKHIETVTKLKNLESLGVGIFDLDNFDFLNDITPSIKELNLHQTKSKKTKINIIERFTDLEYLYLEGQQKGIESLNNLKKLKKIVLRSISTDNLNYLIGLNDLWSVDIKLGGIKNFDALTTLPNIKYLELWQIRDLADLTFISKLTSLQNLYIQSLKQVQKLPDFGQLNNLRRIYLENLKGLTDLSSLKSAKGLKEFIYILAENQEPENLLPALENSNVKRIFCKFGSIRKNNNFDALAIKYQKEQYKHIDFNYEELLPIT